MDLGFNHKLLSPYDFNPVLKGCFKEGIYENINAYEKLMALKMLYRKKKSWTFDTLYIELDSLDPETLP